MKEFNFYTYIYYCFFRFQRWGQSSSFGWSERSIYMRASWLLIMFEVGVTITICLSLAHLLGWDIKHPMLFFLGNVAPFVYIHFLLFGSSEKVKIIVDKYDSLPTLTNSLLGFLVLLLIIFSCYFIISFFMYLSRLNA